MRGGGVGLVGLVLVEMIEARDPVDGFREQNDFRVALVSSMRLGLSVMIFYALCISTRQTGSAQTLFSRSQFFWSPCL